jgi:CRISPR-associated endonuclease/helicase Cas3
MPGVALGEGYKVPGSKIDLSTMEVGADANGRPSWLDSALGLRDALGPFKLAYLESLVRAADVRASEDPGLEGVFR